MQGGPWEPLVHAEQEQGVGRESSGTGGLSREKPWRAEDAGLDESKKVWPYRTAQNWKQLRCPRVRAWLNNGGTCTPYNTAKSHDGKRETAHTAQLRWCRNKTRTEDRLQKVHGGSDWVWDHW